jgi:hypothetical protein
MTAIAPAIELISDSKLRGCIVIKRRFQLESKHRRYRFASRAIPNTLFGTIAILRHMKIVCILKHVEI